jgi:hypothetical protein
MLPHHLLEHPFAELHALSPCVLSCRYALLEVEVFGSCTPFGYETKGTGYCEPDLPYWLKKSSTLDECRDTCNGAKSCIGFDIESFLGTCKVPPVTSTASVLTPLPNTVSISDAGR